MSCIEASTSANRQGVKRRAEDDLICEAKQIKVEIDEAEEIPEPDFDESMRADLWRRLGEALDEFEAAQEEQQNEEIEGKVKPFLFNRSIVVNDYESETDNGEDERSDEAINELRLRRQILATIKREPEDEEEQH